MQPDATRSDASKVSGRSRFSLFFQMRPAAAGNIVDVGADDLLGEAVCQPCRDGRLDISALCGEAIVAESIHQLEPQFDNAVRVDAETSRSCRKTKTGQ